MPISAVFCLFATGLSCGMDLPRAVVVTPDGASKPAQKAAQMPREESKSGRDPPSQYPDITQST
jgi:hypothetical protein